GDPLPAGAVARLGTVRFRHGGWSLLGPAFLADGKTLVSAAEGGQAISFWEAATGKLLREIGTDTLSVRRFTVSPDGSWVAVGGFLPREDGHPTGSAVVRVYDTASGQVVQNLKRETRDLDNGVMAFAPGGRQLASLDGNGALHIEDVGTGVE